MWPVVELAFEEGADPAGMLHSGCFKEMMYSHHTVLVEQYAVELL